MNSAQRGSSSGALLEITGSKGSIHVNGKTYRKNACLILSGGDEVVFGSSAKYAYVSFIYIWFLGKNLSVFAFNSCVLLPSFLACICGHFYEDIS